VRILSKCLGTLVAMTVCFYYGVFAFSMNSENGMQHVIREDILNFSSLEQSQVGIMETDIANYQSRHRGPHSNLQGEALAFTDEQSNVVGNSTATRAINSLQVRVQISGALQSAMKDGNIESLYLDIAHVIAVRTSGGRPSTQAFIDICFDKVDFQGGAIGENETGGIVAWSRAVNPSTYSIDSPNVQSLRLANFQIPSSHFYEIANRGGFWIRMYGHANSNSTMAFAQSSSIVLEGVRLRPYHNLTQYPCDPNPGCGYDCSYCKDEGCPECYDPKDNNPGNGNDNGNTGNNGNGQNPPTEECSNSTSNSPSSNVGVIIGATCGGVVALSLGGLACWWFLVKRRRLKLPIK